jgi:Tfp pilus assembly protein PilF
MVRSPLDYNWPLALASLYNQEGNKTEASLYFRAALKLSPNNEQLLKLKADYIK